MTKSELTSRGYIEILCSWFNMSPAADMWKHEIYLISYVHYFTKKQVCVSVYKKQKPTLFCEEYSVYGEEA